MSAALTVIVVLAVWVAVSFVLPIVSALRASRALRTVDLLREQIARMSDEIAALRQRIERFERPGGPSPATAAAAAHVSRHTPPALDIEPRESPAARTEVIVVTATTTPVVVESTRTAEPGPPLGEATPTSADVIVPPVAPHAGVTAERVREAPRPPAPPSRPAEPTEPAGTAPRRPWLTPSLETRIGSNWLLYAGLATLVLGASYFIKYAFENEWITPAMRVVLGELAGLALLAAGRRFSRRGLTFFGQMLCGGGIILLYLAVYAALNFYTLIGARTAFLSMIVITVGAAGLAHVERSEPLAVLAVAGGFLTPFLVGGREDAQHTLFAYDALLVAGTLWLARRHQWPRLHLASFALVTLTLVTWADAHYVPSKWLGTELWLTLFTVLFLLVWRTLPATTDVSTQVARGLLGVTPLLYHGVSISILWRHPAGYLVYLIAATALCVILAGHWKRPWVRAAAWLLVSGPALGWFAERPPRWDTAPLVALFGIYLLHLAAQLRETTVDDQRPTALEVVLLHANGLWVWAGLGLLLERIALARLGRATFVLAAWNLGLAAVTALRTRELALNFVALAGALAAAAVAIEFDGAAVTVAWAAEGGALVVLGMSSRRGWVQGVGGVLLVAAIARLVQDLAAPLAVHMTTVFNARSASALFVVAILGFLAWRYQRTPEAIGGRTPGTIVGALVVSAAVLLIAWMSAEVNAWFATAARPIGRDVALSTMWAAYALALVAVGIRRDYRPLRVLGIAIFALTATKVWAIDLARLDRLYRILSTLGLGLLLIGGSYLYQRVSPEKSESVS